MQRAEIVLTAEKWVLPAELQAYRFVHRARYPYFRVVVVYHMTYMYV